MGNSATKETSGAKKASVVSSDKIDAIVDGFMKNHAINNALIPDVIERSIYKNVLTLVMGVLQEVTESTTVEVLGHKLEVKIKS